MSDRKWVSNAGWGCYARDGYNRCACGNNHFAISCHSYEDSTHGYILSCWDCGRRVEVDGTEEDLRRLWNEYNDGTAKITYNVTFMPEFVTIYVKPGEDVKSALKDVLFKVTKLERVKPVMM